MFCDGIFGVITDAFMQLFYFHLLPKKKISILMSFKSTSTKLAIFRATWLTKFSPRFFDIFFIGM